MVNFALFLWVQTSAIKCPNRRKQFFRTILRPSSNGRSGGYLALPNSDR